MTPIDLPGLIATVAKMTAGEWHSTPRHSGVPAYGDEVRADDLELVIGLDDPSGYGDGDGPHISGDDVAGIITLRNAWPAIAEELAELRQRRAAADERAAKAQEGSQCWRDLCALFDWKGDTPSELAGMAVAELRELRSYRERREAERCETCVFLSDAANVTFCDWLGIPVDRHFSCKHCTQRKAGAK